MSEGNRPIRVYSLGSLELAIFESQYQDKGKTYRFTINERYKDKEGKWRSSPFINTRDMGKVNMLLVHVAGQAVKLKDWDQQQTSPPAPPASPVNDNGGDDVCPF